MSNNLSAGFKAYWSRRMQRKMNKIDVFRAIASFEEEAQLKKGDRVHRPYRSELTPQDYTRGTAFSVQDIETTDEYLVVDQAKVIPFYVDDLDELQSSYKDTNEFADDCAVKLGNLIDAAVLAEVLNADSVVDEAAFGGTAGNGITATSGNIQKIFSTADKKLNRLNVPNEGRYAVISPDLKQVLLDYLAGKESQMGDEVGLNGKIGRYYNFDVRLSNNLAWTGVLALATNPTADDTVTINGVVFKFVASPSAAGDIDIGADADTSRANLAAAINGGAGAGTAYVAISAANRKLLYNFSAVNDDTNNILTVTAKGASYVTVSEALTAAADIWTAAKQIQHNVFGRKGATDVVVQKYPNLEIKDVQDKIGKNMVPWTLYGLKTFSEGKKQLVDVKVRTDQF